MMNSALTLDVIVATYNRAGMLRRLLQSVAAASLPETLQARITVVDNNSSDDTPDVVDMIAGTTSLCCDYCFEPQQGRSHALNAGLRRVTGDLVGFLDDDEEIAPDWFSTVDAVFRDASVEFISGPYLPKWGGPVPEWLPKEYPAVIGWIDAGPDVLEYGKNYSGTMMGGNAVVRTEAIRAVGPFNTALGRRGNDLAAGEDADMHQRLIVSGARGLYVPGLKIYHYVPPERLTKRYYRKWCLDRARSMGRLEAIRPQAVPHVAGVPRYMIGTAARAVPVLMSAAVTGRWRQANTFAKELALWDLVGFACGRLSPG
jgi:glycosyltransferase involved in cell wall biosynthesis